MQPNGKRRSSTSPLVMRGRCQSARCKREPCPMGTDPFAFAPGPQGDADSVGSRRCFAPQDSVHCVAQHSGFPFDLDTGQVEPCGAVRSPAVVKLPAAGQMALVDSILRSSFRILASDHDDMTCGHSLGSGPSSAIQRSSCWS